MPPNTACSRRAQLRQLSVSFDGWRSGGWHAADARPLGRLLLPDEVRDTLTRLTTRFRQKWANFDWFLAQRARLRQRNHFLLNAFGYFSVAYAAISRV